MKQTIGKSQFIDAFHNCGRGEQFSYSALCAMFEYIEDYEQDSGEEIELDVIALCCEWEELTVLDAAEQYSIDLSDAETDEEKTELVKDYLDDNSPYAVELDTGDFLFVQF